LSTVPVGLGQHTSLQILVALAVLGSQRVDMVSAPDVCVASVRKW